MELKTVELWNNEITQRSIEIDLLKMVFKTPFLHYSNIHFQIKLNHFFEMLETNLLLLD